MDPAVIGHKPLAIKWLQGLAWLKLGFFAVIVVLSFSFLPPAQSGFRDGFLEAAGYLPDQYGDREAGAIIGRNSIPALLAWGVLQFTARRRLAALRIVALLGVLFSLAQIPQVRLSLLISLIMLVLTFVSSTKAYCDQSAAHTSLPKRDR